MPNKPIRTPSAAKTAGMNRSVENNFVFSANGINCADLFGSPQLGQVSAVAGNEIPHSGHLTSFSPGDSDAPQCGQLVALGLMGLPQLGQEINAMVFRFLNSVKPRSKPSARGCLKMQIYIKFSNCKSFLFHFFRTSYHNTLSLKSNRFSPRLLPHLRIPALPLHTHHLYPFSHHSETVQSGKGVLSVWPLCDAYVLSVFLRSFSNVSPTLLLHFSNVCRGEVWEKSWVCVR